MDFAADSEFWSLQIADQDFTGIDIEGKEFEACSFNRCNFSEAQLRHCNFVDCEFNQCNLSVATIDYSKFSDVSFNDCKLAGVNWTRVSWPRLALAAPVAFYNCVLTDSSFYGLALSELKLEACKAHGVDFREGDFSGANFRHSDFSGAYFGNTRLTEADFTEASHYAIDISQNDVRRATFSRHEAINLLAGLEIELVD